eukprot:356298-Chlamydomonas_euryale.AAC.2
MTLGCVYAAGYPGVALMSRLLLPAAAMNRWPAACGCRSALQGIGWVSPPARCALERYKTVSQAQEASGHLTITNRLFPDRTSLSRRRDQRPTSTLGLQLAGGSGMRISQVASYKF